MEISTNKREYIAAIESAVAAAESGEAAETREALLSATGALEKMARTSVGKDKLAHEQKARYLLSVCREIRQNGLTDKALVAILGKVPTVERINFGDFAIEGGAEEDGQEAEEPAKEQLPSENACEVELPKGEEAVPDFSDVYRLDGEDKEEETGSGEGIAEDVAEDAAEDDETEAERDDKEQAADNPATDCDERKSGIRPLRLCDFIGQEKLKKDLEIAIAAAKGRGDVLEHVLLFGSAGLGKTTIAQIIANEMGGRLITMNAPTIRDVTDFVHIVEKLKRADVLFIDEIHRLPTAVCESIYLAMEDYVLLYVDGKGENAESRRVELPKFTLIGATTHSGMLSKPIRDRFGFKFKLEPYNTDELKTIAKNTARAFGYIFDDDAATEVAKRSRGIPRVCNNFVKRLRDVAQLCGQTVIGKGLTDAFFADNEIDDMGLDDLDRSVLFALNDKYEGRAVGLETLASTVNEGANIIDNQVEPYLITLGFLDVTGKGRLITDAGRAYVEAYRKARETPPENDESESADKEV